MKLAAMPLSALLRLLCAVMLASAIVQTWPAKAAGAEPPSLVLTGTANSHPLSGHLARLEDPSGRRSFEDIRGDRRFVARPAAAAERNYTSGAVWYRFKVVRGHDAPEDWILAIGEPFIDDIQVYAESAGRGLQSFALGRNVPVASLPLAARRHVLRLQFPFDEPTQLYVRLASHDEIQFDASLWQADTLMFEEIRTATLIGMFLSVLLIIAAMYVLFGIGLRDSPMVAYAAYVGSYVLFGVSHTGLATILFPGASSSVLNVITGVGVLGNLAALVFMWDRVLRLRTTFPRLHKAYMAGCAAALACIVTAPTSLFIHLVRPSFLATLLATLVSLALAIVVLRRERENKLVRSYAIAFLPFLVFAGLHAAEALFPSMLDIIRVRQIGTAAMLAHIAILSLALAGRIRRMQRDRLRSRELAAAFAKTELALAGEQAARLRLQAFIDMATHEFKTPLAVIDGAAQVLGLTAASGRPDVAARIETIRRSVRRLVRLVETCLAGERVEKSHATLAPVAAERVLADTAERNDDPGRAPLLVHSTDPVALCEADTELLGVALDAMIDNARRYGPENAPVELFAVSEGDWVTFSVADRGPGVEAAEAVRIFDKYYRGVAHSAAPGTGIGLHLVRIIAGLHGGHAFHKQRQGGGSIFAISVPLARAGAEERVGLVTGKA